MRKIGETAKRKLITLYDEDLKRLKALRKKMGEPDSEVIRKAIEEMYCYIFEVSLEDRIKECKRGSSEQ